MKYILLLSAFLFTAHLWSSDCTGSWKGEFRYNGDALPPVEVTGTLKQEGDDIAGHLSESNWSEAGAAPLESDIKGTIDGEGKLKFSKTYDGKGGQSHTVRYEGTLSEDGKTISGRWNYSNASGPFTFEKSDP
jgi:hypothetical protein